MKNKIMVLLLVLLGVIANMIFISTAIGYGEKTGYWSASEKRQIIDLLSQIADNTK